MVWLPWVLVVVALVVGLALGAGGMRLRMSRGASHKSPPQTEPVSLPAEPAPDQEQAVEAPAAEVYARPEWPEDRADGDLRAAEGDPATEEDMEEPASDLSAALRAQHEVLEKLEAKYRNQAAATDDEPPKRRRGSASVSSGED